MMKTIKVTSCEECPHFDYDNNQCVLTYKRIENCTKIPGWCPLGNELAAWKAEAMAAREYIKLIEPDAREYAGQEMFERVEWGYKGERDAYLAARVKDGE